MAKTATIHRWKLYAIFFILMKKCNIQCANILSPFQILVDSMHERKIVMASRVNGFIGLPGGFGTFEEVRESRITSLIISTYLNMSYEKVLEVTTWTQLGIHDKR